MALVQCSECNREISDQAETCPHCGMRRTHKTERYVRRIALVLAVALWIAVGMAVIFSRSASPRAVPSDPPRTAPTAEGRAP